MKTIALILLLMAPFASLNAAAKPGDVYIYPAKGQSKEQLERDRYECYLWASRETGFDPAQADANSQDKLVRVPVGPNEKQGATLKGTVIGAIAGAAIGSDSRNAGHGAAVGAAVGTMIGATVEQQGQKEAEEQARAKARDIAKQQAEDATRYADYRRAFSACLEGRNYVVR
jgi:hypothetical protein